MTPSKMFTGEASCYICGNKYGLDVHHCIHGRGLRKLADEDGLWVWLCRKHHAELHDLPDHPHDAELKAAAQKVFIDNAIRQGYPKDAARDLWLSRYGRFFDNE